ncbi:MAG: PadR family transcriptional regulator [Defluviitaleaceae bacterium]|nr:PadR family transcriptional regulator [Defluviitaleaceae bacterium]MCL2240124.1 PadR family transcriptional regulator [Defluviitaleaceae bacterium]
MSIQLKKGTLELCVLSLLSKADRYGFELVGAISAEIVISEGTIYPLLKRIKDEGYVSTYLQESSEGPPRKYYRITDYGRTTLKTLEAEWKSIVKGIENILAQNAPN